MADMAQLQPLVGRWVTTITMLSPPDMAGQVFHAVDSYRWLTGGQALVHEVEARMGGPVNSIEVYSLSDGVILSRSYDGGGGVSDYRASMENGVFRIEGKTERLTSRATGADAVEGLWQLKGEKGWSDWMRVRLDRVA